jgi:perosamine synthetase
MKYKVPQLELFVGKEELENLKKVIETSWLTEGPFSKEFLEKIQKFTKAKYAVLANNGTLALFLSLKALDIGQGDEVIVPDFTFSASASSVVFTGGVPKFVDVHDSDLNMDVSKIEEAITTKTKAIMPVHIYGRSCDMDQIVKIASKHNLKVIEDAAQGYGVFYKDVHVGTIGDIGMISFFADKTVTTGEGAVILTNDDDTFNKLKLLRNQGRPNSGTFVHPSLGMNFRMCDLQSAVGVAQLDKFKDIERKKLKHYELYRSLLKDTSQVRFLENKDHTNFVPFRVNIRVPRLLELLKFFESRGIQTRRLYYPMHRQPYLSYLGYKEAEFPVSNTAFDDGLSLPVFYNLTDEQITYVCSAIKEFFYSDN